FDSPLTHYFAPGKVLGWICHWEEEVEGRLRRLGFPVKGLG
ncbi:unnamed protein product, partial [Arabidopsis halleri]